MSQPKLLYAYIDEVGDRGVGPSASPFFAMSAVVVPQENIPELRATVAGLRSDFRVPEGKALHWAEHVKSFERRQRAARVLGSLQAVTINYVIFEKAAIPVSAGIYGDTKLFYNYIAGLMMERLILTAKFHPVGMRPIKIRFGHVRGFKHEETANYFAYKASTAETWVPWKLVHGQIKWVGQSQFDGLQAADVYGGMLRSAIFPNKFGDYEHHHLLGVRHQIRRYKDRAMNAGFKVMCLPGSFESLPWWPKEGL